MNKTIGKRIKQLRQTKGYTQEHLADLLRISQSAYARLENGETYTWASHLEAICGIFEVNPEDIVRLDKIVINENQQGGSSNNAYIINQLSEKLIEQYEQRLKEKDDLIKELRNGLVK